MAYLNMLETDTRNLASISVLDFGFDGTLLYSKPETMTGRWLGLL